MQVLNKTTRIVEFNGSPHDFRGIAFIDTVVPADADSYRRNNEYEVSLSDADWVIVFAFPEMPRDFGFDVCKRWAVERIKQQHANALKLLSGSVTSEERDTWSVQLQAAKDFKAGRASATQKAMLDSLLVDGESKTSLSDSIIAKDTAVQALIGIAGGLRRKTERAAKAAETIEEIESVMENAAKEMDAAIAAFKDAAGATASEPASGES